MGNTISGHAPALLETSYLGELGSDVTYNRSLGQSRFLKSIRSLHRSGGLLVIKIFAKPEPSLSLKRYTKRLKAERDALQDAPNVVAYQIALETEKAGYLLRPWGGNNLYDRISTRPFLGPTEKKWIAFQLLTAVRDVHDRRVTHGDIKSENVLVTSHNWIYLTDFCAPFKPTFLPLDDPSIFSYFFDASGRRTCYIAPERFLANPLAVPQERNDIVPSMDVFSLGCVLAELCADGVPPFSLSQMFKFRTGEYSPKLSAIEDAPLRDLIKSMLSLDPARRKSCEEYLEEYRDKAFPEVFWSLHPFISDINDIQPTSSSLSSNTNGRSEVMSPSLNAGADEKIDRIWAEFDRIVVLMGTPSSDSMSENRSADRQSLFPLHLNVPPMQGPVISKHVATDDGVALLILSLLCANIRNCARPASMIRALDLLLAVGIHLTDETQLDRLLPYIVSLLKNEVASIKAAALRALTQTLLNIAVITKTNAQIFNEYILPNVSPLATDFSILVRATYAQCLAPLAQTGAHFLEMARVITNESGLKFSLEENQESTYDYNLTELQNLVQDQAITLLSDSSSHVKRSLLTGGGITTLCIFFGRAKTADILLSHTITYLNDPDWRLRAAFFESTVSLAACIGGKSVEEYIVPLMTQALGDSEDAVIIRVLSSLTTLVELGLLKKTSLFSLLDPVIGFVCHSNLWVRQGAASFLSCVANKTLKSTDTWCILYPLLRNVLVSDTMRLDELEILDAALPPLSRSVLDAICAWARRSPNSTFWKLGDDKAKMGTGLVPAGMDDAKALSKSEEYVGVACRMTPGLTSPSSDEEQLRRLQSRGAGPYIEFQIMALRMYILRRANVVKPPTGPLSGESHQLLAGQVSLQNLKISAQTIFYGYALEDSFGTVRYQSTRPHHIESGGRRFSFNSPGTPSETGRSAPRYFSDGQTMEDLRRKLAHAGSTSSLSSTSRQSALQSPSPPQGPFADPSLPPNVVVETNFTPQDGRNDLALRPKLPPKTRSRVSAIGVELGRALPATVSPNEAVATGTINIEPRSLDSSAVLGQSAPMRVGSFSSHAGEDPKDPFGHFYSTYEGQDQNIRRLLERLFVESELEPAPELGRFVPNGIPRKRAVAVRVAFPGREKTVRKPEGSLIASLSEHSAAITAIATSPDHVFFVTGSEDGTVKVWDTMRLEKNVTSRSRHTYRLGGRVTSICMLQNSHCVACASDNGALMVYRIDISLSDTLPRYYKQAIVRNYRVDPSEEGFISCMVHRNTDKSSMLIYGTSLSTITALDLRRMRTLQTFKQPRHLGPISCLCLDPAGLWLVAGTSEGALCLWDLRFGLLLRTWRVGHQSTSAIHRCVIHPSKGKGRWVMVSADFSRARDARRTSMIEVWDIDQGQLVESFEVEQPGQNITNLVAPSTVARSVNDVRQSAADAIEAFLAQQTETLDFPATPTKLSPPNDQDLAPMLEQPDVAVRAILTGIDYGEHRQQRSISMGAPSNRRHPLETASSAHTSKPTLAYILTAGDDRKIRFWDLDSSESSGIVSGLEADADKPKYKYIDGPLCTRTEITSGNNLPLRHRVTLIASYQQQLLRNHHDAITALGLIDLPFRCVVSGDRSGVIKVFS